MKWNKVGFGPLHDRAIPRIIVLVATMVAIGVQTFFCIHGHLVHSGHCKGILGSDFEKP